MQPITPQRKKKIRGFWVNELYSPWVTLGKMAQDFVNKKDDPEQLKTFVNTSLGETWEVKGDTLDDQLLYGRRESYGPIIPENAYLLTCGVDVQDDRFELEVVAHGEMEETWGIEYRIFHGSPAKPEIWKDLKEYLTEETFRHVSGADLHIACTCIDTGGHHTKETYEFLRFNQYHKIYGTKGSSVATAQLVGRASKQDHGRVKLFTVGTGIAKTTIFNRLKIEEPGARYMHFPEYYDEEYFLQLTAEKRIRDKWIKIRPRNEALDIRVLNLVAFDILKPNMKKVKENLMKKVKRTEEGKGKFPVKEEKKEVKTEPIQREKELFLDVEDKPKKKKRRTVRNGFTRGTFQR